ncbi:MAG: ChaN family lipoprotein [Bacteroidia bacterium]|nr:ChaN family lipoprotein [Bacteroidia bacterium]
MRYVVALLACLLAQDKPAYVFYTAKGKKIAYSEVVSRAQKADVVLFGELHNNPIAHWLQYELVKDLHKKKPGQLIIGMEMLEADQQEAVQRYMRGEVASIEKLGEEIRLWPNFRTDYAPLLLFARSQSIPVYATNVPRVLAREVSQKGASVMEMWGEKEKQYTAPLPFPRLDTLPSYRRMDEMAQRHGMDPEPFRLAQMLKDATMAHFIVRAARPGAVFLHLNGRYHSDYHEGIAAYLRLYNPTLRVLVISTEEVADPLRYKPTPPPVADIIVVVPESMTKTH